MTDDKFIENMKAGGVSRNQSIEFLYRNVELRQKVFAYLKRLGANNADIQDIYHDGFVVLDKNIRNEKFRGESSIEGYFFSICKYICLNHLRKNNKISFVDNVELSAQLELDSFAPYIEEHIVIEEDKDLIETTLSQIGESCKKVLTLWKLSYSMSEIAELTGLSSPEMAKKKRYQCHQKLMVLINNNPNLKQALLSA